MKIGDRIRCALSVWVLALLTACGDGTFQPHLSSAQPIQTTMKRAAQLHSTQSQNTSWMLPEAKSRDLLYVSAIGQIYVYAYPSGKLEGVLTGPLGPEGDCVDKAGNIWITDAGRGEILEYAHGGTSPIATLSDAGQEPFGCSVDPNTGDLAVADFSAITIFKHAKGSPTTYFDTAIKYYSFAGYDNRSNLFIDGSKANGLFQFAELPKGSSTFTNFSLYSGSAAGVQWDGKYITYGDWPYNTIWQVQVSGSHAKVVGETGIFGSQDSVYQYTFSNFGKSDPQAQRVVALYGATVAVWNYPAGGSPRTIYVGNYYPVGVAISPASN